LFVDLVPRSCWFTNVRTCVSQQDWERLRRMILRRAGHACEACGAKEDRVARRWLEAHERWSYDEHAGVQTLRRLICLCSPCHLVTHFGHANVTGQTDKAFTHLCAVTGMTQAQAWNHVRTAEELWIERSRRVWGLDLSMFINAGVTLRRPERPAAARVLLPRTDPPRGHGPEPAHSPARASPPAGFLRSSQRRS
jgi:hypothetical protein